MQTNLIIDKRFCGPPNSGNGGYSAGLIAANVPFFPEVTLRLPPPLNSPMQLNYNEKNATLKQGDKLIAEAKVTDFQLSTPVAISYDQATAAAKQAAPYQQSTFNNCFVCGALRKEGDGLKLYPGAINKTTVATPWVPFAALGNEQGVVKTEYIWAALDCPGAWAVQDESELFLLGRMSAKEIISIKTGQKYIVQGWVINKEGRKIWSGTAIYDEEGNVCAEAKATWIILKKS